MTDTTNNAAVRGGSVDRAFNTKRISWGAIFGGAAVVIAIQIVLGLLGAGIGLGTVNVAAGDTPNASSLGVGAALWWLISSSLALFAGGYITAWLAGNVMKFDGMLHGLIMWSIATILTIYLLSSAVGGVIGGGLSTISGVASTTSSGIKSALAPIANSVGISPDMIQQQAQAYLKPTNTDLASMSPQDAQKDVAQNLYTYMQGGQAADAAKNRIIDVTAAQMHISREDAAKNFDDAHAKAMQSIDQAKQKASEAADATASRASITAFGAFVAFLLGAIAASLGGGMGAGRLSNDTVNVVTARRV